MRLGLLAEISSAGVAANVVTYNTAINACQQGQLWQYAPGLLAEMPSAGVAANVVTYNAAISACP